MSLRGAAATRQSLSRDTLDCFPHGTPAGSRRKPPRNDNGGSGFPHTLGMTPNA